MNKDDLMTAISEANMAYTAGIPFMSDSDYDLLWQQLHAIDPTNDLLYHTAQQRGNLTGATFHKYPIYGTTKAFNMTDLGPYLTRCGNRQLVFEPKYDGCAVVLTKQKDGWHLTYEGDGFKGVDISPKMTYIKFPEAIKHFQALEVLIPWADWHEDYGSNPRNTVAGWLARKHDVPPIRMTAVSHNYGELSYDYSYDGDLDKMSEILLELYNKWNKIYPLDGIMIKVKNEEERLIIGNNGKSNNWSIAWKPPIQTKETIITDIEWNVSRLGRVIPTVVYEEIELCSTINSRVTGNNAQWIIEKRIAKGNVIVIGKAGEIIPKIISCKELYIPIISMNCPVCHNPLSWEGVHLVCNAPGCIAQLIKTIHHFYSAKGIKIDGLAEKTIEKILQDTTCYNILKDKPWALLDQQSYEIEELIIAIIGDKIATNIKENIKAISGNVHMAHFVAGLGLPGLAYKTALRLCQFLITGKLTVHVSDKARNNFISAVNIFNPAIDELQNFAFANIPSPAKAIYCITGTLSKSREAMIAILEKYNYEFSSSVTRETNYLIVGEEPGKTKVNKATKYNIPQVNEEQLFRIITGE